MGTGRWSDLVGGIGPRPSLLTSYGVPGSRLSTGRLTGIPSSGGSGIPDLPTPFFSRLTRSGLERLKSKHFTLATTERLSFRSHSLLSLLRHSGFLGAPGSTVGPPDLSLEYRDSFSKGRDSESKGLTCYSPESVTRIQG